MILMKESHMGASTSMHANNKVLYIEVDRPHGSGGCGRSVHNGGGWQEQNYRYNRNVDSNFGPSMSKGRQGGAGNWQEKVAIRQLVMWLKGPKSKRVLEEAC